MWKKNYGNVEKFTQQPTLRLSLKSNGCIEQAGFRGSEYMVG